MSTLNLLGQWHLTSPQRPDIETTCTLPGDIHSALLNARHIPDPYFACNEQDVQWVSECEWHLSRTFTVSADMLSGLALQLSLTFVDTLATVLVNGEKVLSCSNMFRPFGANILPFVHEGENRIEIQLHRNDEEAKRRAERLPFPVPWAVGNNQIPHMNTLRKTQCHAGWDWGICLLASGIYGEISLQALRTTRLDRVRTQQEWLEDGSCTLSVTTHYDMLEPGATANLSILFDGNCYEFPLAGKHTGTAEYTHRIKIREPKLWWPAGYGDQPLYNLEVRLNGQCIQKRLGLRQLELDTTPDSIGSAMMFRVNGIAITAKGANWIPADARPANQTPERYRQLLEDAVAANMNMIRVWGGGMYEQDTFYNLCDELGLLVWQDLMFSCALYPSTPDFLEDVREEVRYQVNRLADHPSLALWCGDNEVIGAIGWYPESKTNREKYVVNYDRLNRTLSEVVEQEDTSRRFWASSPCNGELDFGDAWHDDNCGDMHFWDVWHSGKSFDAYYGVKPRFCSEFGFQSWPSLPTVKAFAEEEDWNVTSPTFEQHQKNGRGNSIITEMITRYFRFPTSFKNQLYLSQVQQALAIKTASEYWRAYKDHCRGILYWQLNDCWPVSSWSSLEYSGRWKQLHYHARRFFAPHLATFIQENNTLSLHVVSDSREKAGFTGKVLKISWAGDILESWPLDVDAEADCAKCVWQITVEDGQNTRDGFYHVMLESSDSIIENSHFPCAFKRARLEKANITWQVLEDDSGCFIELDCENPAFFVHLEYTGPGRFEDSSFTLLPSSLTGTKRQIRFIGDITKQDLEAELKVYDLRSTY